MNNFSFTILLAGSIVLVSCGQGNSSKEIEEKNDSIAKVDQIRKSADSLYSIFENGRKQDSVNKKKQDSISKAEKNKPKKKQ